MKIIIIPRFKVDLVTLIDEPFIMISIRDPNLEDVDIPYNSDCLATVRLSFWDLDDRTADRDKIMVMEDAKLIADILNRHKGYDCIVCQCEAGRSRSAGVGAALAKCFVGDDSYYFRTFTPNMRVYRLVLEAMLAS